MKCSAALHFNQARLGRFQKESPAVMPGLPSVCIIPPSKTFARISLPRKFVNRGRTEATKWLQAKMGRCCSDNTAGVEQCL
jgi:hypothetical protein